MRKNTGQMKRKIKPLNDTMEMYFKYSSVYFKTIMNNNCFNGERCFVCFIFDIEKSKDEVG